MNVKYFEEICERNKNNHSLLAKLQEETLDELIRILNHRHLYHNKAEYREEMEKARQKQIILNKYIKK